MTGWGVRGIELPYGDRIDQWWIDDSGTVGDQPIAGSEMLPGGYFLAGLVDAHAHPAIASRTDGPLALDRDEARANLVRWAETGISLIRDVGSPGGLTLELADGPGLPGVAAAGRFLAPPGYYFPSLLDHPVNDDGLVDAALAEVSRGATWVKVIADFPNLATGSEAEATYPLARIEALVTAVHAAGARVAVHSTIANAGQLVTAAVDSIEHGTGLELSALEEMARRGTAWTPTIGALDALLESSLLPAERRPAIQEGRARVIELLPHAVRLGVPIMAGTDVTGSIPGEVALLARAGLDPRDALAAASVWPRRFLGITQAGANVVTYRHDPRDDPLQLANPAAVVIRGTRLR